MKRKESESGMEPKHIRIYEDGIKLIGEYKPNDVLIALIHAVVEIYGQTVEKVNPVISATRIIDVLKEEGRNTRVDTFFAELDEMSKKEEETPKCRLLN